jgi:ADP-heptose:LPS heptosyltransferase
MNLKFKHSGNAGDIIYSLNAFRSACILRDKNAILYLKLDEPIQLHPSFKHPLGGVMLNRYMFDNLRPLLLECDFIEDVVIYTNQKVDYDLDTFRKIGFNLGAGDIKKWYLYAFPELQEYYSNEQVLKGYNTERLQKSNYYGETYLVLNRSERYNNGQIDYSILNQVQLPIYFVGTDTEFAIMKNIVWDLQHKKVANFLELKDFIAYSKLFIGNQSMCYAIAEQVGANRLLEVFFGCPNVITEGLEMFNQEGFIHALKQNELI